MTSIFVRAEEEMMGEERAVMVDGQEGCEECEGSGWTAAAVEGDQFVTRG